MAKSVQAQRSKVFFGIVSFKGGFADDAKLGRGVYETVPARVTAVQTKIGQQRQEIRGRVFTVELATVGLVAGPPGCC